MAANLRFETSTSSPDGAQFLAGISNGHRGHGASSSSMDRSSSFRDNHEGRTHGGGGNTPGPTCDPVPLSQVLSLDVIPLGEPRYARQMELRRATNAATGTLVDDPSLGGVQMKSLEALGTEELKRVKASINDNSTRARERSRYLAEAIAKLDKYRSSLQSKKRSRPDTTNERIVGSSPTERSLQLKGPGPHIAGDSVKPPDKNKSLVPNKRLRTSIAEGARPNNPSTKKSTDRESPRSASLLPSPTEEKGRTLNEGWEKTRLKGRRSAIKSDPAISPAGNGVLEGERDGKWSGQHRLSQETRPRPTEAHGLRSGPVHGVTSIHKAETSLQMNGSVSRGATKGEIDAAGGDKGDRFPGNDKERLPKNGLKPPLQDELHLLASSSTVTKGKAARAPRSGSMASTNLSHLSRVSSFNEREKPPVSSKVQLPSGQGNRKRPAASRSLSPVTQWVGQRSQKMARVARRGNFMPPGGPLSSTDDTNSVAEGLCDRDPAATVAVRSSTGNNGASGLPRRMSAGNVHSPAQSKPRNERMMSSVVVSESEESEEAGENKAKEKGKKQGEWEPRPAVSNQKTGNQVLPTKISQAVLKEEVGDGVRRQGRSGRNFSIPKPVVTTIEKVDISASTAKQLRSARSEKPDRPGRTPTKKATVERKSLTRIRRPPVGNNVADTGFVLTSPGESDDDHEELANAVRAAVDASVASCSNDFWKEMEPYFAFLTADDLAYLRQLADSKWSSDMSSTPSNDGTEKTSYFANGNRESEGAPDRLEVRTGGRIGGGGGWFDKIYPLSQRLLAALINEGEEENSKGLEGDGLRDGYCSATSTLPDHKFRDISASHGSLYSNGHGNHRSMFSCEDPEDILAEAKPESKTTPGTCDGNHLSGTKSEGYCASRPTGLTATWESQYEQMSFDDRILLELQSIGLAVEQVPDLSQREEDEICVEIFKLQDELKDQICVNRQRVHTLERAVLSKREEETRERERLAISKLVEFAYSKRKGCRSSGAAGTKGAGTKGAKAAALAFSKRTLARVRKFESGHSCFVDSSLRDILFCNATKANEGNGSVVDGEASITPAVSETSVPKLGAAGASECSGKPILQRADGKEKVSQVEGTPIEHPRGKDVPWASWKEREVSTEDLAGATNMRNSNSHATVGFGGAKGKRSERERDGKGQGKESHRKNDNERVLRQGLGTVKGERKTKTKPRQKAAPLFKDVNGLLGKPADVPKEKPTTAGQSHNAAVQLEDHSITALGNPVIAEPAIDLAHLTIPEDLGVHVGNPDIGAWLELEDTSLHDQGEFLMGLDVPMDDLSDLGMMM